MTWFHLLPMVGDDGGGHCTGSPRPDDVALTTAVARSAAGLPPRTVDATVDATVIVTARRPEPVVEPCRVSSAFVAILVQ